MTIRRFPSRAWFVLQAAAWQMVRAAGTRDAAQLAFYVVLSFPAMLLLVVWASSTALDDPNLYKDIVDSIVDALPVTDSASRQDIEDLLDRVAEGAGSLGWIVALALLYSASGAIGALRHGVNEAWGTRDTRPYFQGKALDAGLVLVIAPVAMGALALKLLNIVPEALDDRPAIAGTLAFVVTEIAPLAILFALLLLLFRVLPATSPTLRAAWPGALVTTIALLLVRLATQTYIGLFGDAGAVYGALGVALGVLFSIYINAIALVYGSHVSAQIALLPTGEAIDQAIEAEPSKPLHRLVLDELRGLFLRARPRDGSREP